MPVLSDGSGSGVNVLSDGSGSGVNVLSDGSGSGVNVLSDGSGSGVNVLSDGSGFGVNVLSDGSGSGVNVLSEAILSDGSVSVVGIFVLSVAARAKKVPKPLLVSLPLLSQEIPKRRNVKNIQPQINFCKFLIRLSFGEY